MGRGAALGSIFFVVQLSNQFEILMKNGCQLQYYLLLTANAEKIDSKCLTRSSFEPFNFCLFDFINYACRALYIFSWCARLQISSVNLFQCVSIRLSI